MKDYYQTLQVSPDSDAKTIKQAYKRLARQCHPDVCAEGAERFREIREAYETLSNADARAAYDRERRGRLGLSDATLGAKPSRRVEVEAEPLSSTRRPGARHGSRGMSGFASWEGPRTVVRGVVPEPLASPGRQVHRVRCPVCGGRGWAWFGPCPLCRGLGHVSVATEARWKFSISP